jgi:O-antigen ligase
MDVLKATALQFNLKNLLGLLALCYFAAQPWDRYLADAFWLLLALTSLIYVSTKKYQGYDFNTPKPLKSLFWIFALFPLVSILSYALSPLDTLTPKALEPETRWLLIIPMIVAMRDNQIGPRWILALLTAYAASTFISAGQETHWFSKLYIRANGDENAVPYGMFNATIAMMLLTYFISPYIKQFCGLKNKRIVIRIVIFIILSLAIVATFLSGTRAAVLLLPIIATLLYMTHYSFKKGTLSLGLFLLLGAAFYFFQPKNALETRVIQAKENLQSYIAKGEDINKPTSIGQRLEQWKESWCIFTKHPVLGTGPRSFRNAHVIYGGAEYCNSKQVEHPERGSYQAHSLYFNTLGTLGLAGILVLLMLFWRALTITATAFSQPNKVTKLGASLLITVITCHTINGFTLDLWFMNHVVNKNLIVIVLPLLLIFHTYSSPIRSNINLKHRDHGASSSVC